MLPGLIQWQKEHEYPFTLLTEASTDLANDEDLMQMMSRANFFKVFLGLETPDRGSLKECGKFQNTKGIYNCLCQECLQNRYPFKSQISLLETPAQDFCQEEGGTAYSG